MKLNCGRLRRCLKPAAEASDRSPSGSTDRADAWKGRCHLSREREQSRWSSGPGLSFARRTLCILRRPCNIPGEAREKRAARWMRARNRGLPVFLARSGNRRSISLGRERSVLGLRCAFPLQGSSVNWRTSAVVGVAQLVERRTVAPNVAGSNPVSHPKIDSPDFLIPRNSH